MLVLSFPLAAAFVTLCVVDSTAATRALAPDRSTFVTLLGRDTVAAESFVRSESRVEGDLFVRIPSTVHFHYAVDVGANGMPTHSVLETHPMAGGDVAEKRVTIDFGGDSVRVTVDSSGRHHTETHASANASWPYFMTGFGSSYGLYESVGLYDLALAHLPPKMGDTVAGLAVHLATGQPVRRLYIRRSATLVDFDYFRMAWNHVALDSAGRIASVDARETTEQTITTRADGIDVLELAKQFARRDRAGASIGIASPQRTVRASLGGHLVVLIYSSPRLRGRHVLGSVVRYDKVWRTGANEATLISLDKDVLIGGTLVPSGTYSLWTLPGRDGVQLIVNRQRLQWGTEYHPDQDLARIPMTATTASTPREEFSIAVNGAGNAGTLQIAWDTFVWSVTVQVK